MTNTPENLLEVRHIYQKYTGLPAVSLGIQHFQPDGGGYHEGDDLLAAGGRLTTDYSKRESALDRNNRASVNDACAIDIGYFDVTLPSGRRVTLRDRSQWVLAHWDEAPWLRELIYSPDGKVVKRKDRLNKRTSGDRSHLSHDHESYFRSMVRDPRIPAFHQKFWNEMSGTTQQTQTLPKGHPMIAVTFKNDAKKGIYITNGFGYKHWKDWPMYQKMVAAGAIIVDKDTGKPFDFDSKEAIETVIGKEIVEGAA